MFDHEVLANASVLAPIKMPGLTGVGDFKNRKTPGIYAENQTSPVIQHFANEYGSPTGQMNGALIALIVAMGDLMQNYKQMLPEFKEQMQTLLFVQDIANCDNVDEIFGVCMGELDEANPHLTGLVDVLLKSDAYVSNPNNELNNPNQWAEARDIFEKVREKLESYQGDTAQGPVSNAVRFAYHFVKENFNTAVQQLSSGDALDHYTEGEMVQVITDEAKQLGIDPEQAKQMVQEIAEAFKAIFQSGMSLTGVQVPS